MISHNITENEIQRLNFDTCICVVLKGQTRYSCFKRFRGAPFKTFREALDEVTISCIAQSIQEMRQDDAPTPVIYFVETDQTTEFLINPFCVKLGKNYVVVDMSENKAFEIFETIFNGALISTSKHRPIPLSHKKFL